MGALQDSQEYCIHWTQDQFQLSKAVEFQQFS